MSAESKKSSGGGVSRVGFQGNLDEVRSHATFYILPSKLRANHHRDNHDRAALYSLKKELPELASYIGKVFADDRFCFRRIEVLDRVASFKANGQKAPIRAHRSNTMEGDVAAGFLRHVAALWLEVEGELTKCADMRNGLRCEVAEHPRTQEGQLQAVFDNSAENERKDTTPIDKAWNCRRLETLGVSRPDIAKRFGLDQRQVARYLQLLTLGPTEQLDIHEGRLTMSAALKQQSKDGRGPASGPRKSLPHSSIARAIEFVDKRPPPKIGLDPKGMIILDRLICGLETITENTPSIVIDWYEWKSLSAEDAKALAPEKPAREPKPPREPKTLRKKSPVDAKTAYGMTTGGEAN